jgi:hypothetical protein
MGSYQISRSKSQQPLWQLDRIRDRKRAIQKTVIYIQGAPGERYMSNPERLGKFARMTARNQSKRVENFNPGSCK